MSIVHNTSVDFAKRNIAEPVHIVQGDRTLQVIAVELLADGQPYTVPDGAQVNIALDKKDGTFVLNKADSVDGNIATFTITAQMAAVPGDFTPEVQIVDDSGQATTGKFPLIVDKAEVQEGMVESSSEGTALIAYVSRAEEAAEKAEKVQSQIDSVTVNTEAAAKSAKEAAESAIVSATNADLAKASATAAKTSETAAKAHLESVQEEHSDITSEISAANTAIRASAKAAADSATLAESYAHGGTGTRDGEDADNAYAYMKKAQEAANGTIDGEMSDTSTNAVQNKVVTAALANKGDALAYDSKTGELTLKSGDTGLSTVTIKSGSGEISLVITFSEEFKGLEYTIAGGSESYTDTVPSSLIATHTVEALETIYTITAMYEGTEYTTTVRTDDYYGHYFGSLTTWKAYIEATVTDAISGPVVGADVTAKSNTKSYHATTDSTGKATIQIGKAGTYIVSALNTGGETSDSTSVTVNTEGETYTVALSYFKATLTVKVINGNGATVTATDGAGHTYTGTATSGTVALTVYAAGTYTVSSKLNGTAGYTTKKVEIKTNGGSYSAAVLQSGATFSAGSDEVIGAMIDAAQDGDLDLKTLWAVGDTRTISVAAFAGVQNQHAAQSIDIVITSFEDYNNAGAVMQFDMKDCLAEYEYMHSSSTGTYTATDMYKKVLPNYANALPSWLKTRLKPFSIKVSPDGSNTTPTTVTNNKLALRSEWEVFGAKSYAIAGQAEASGGKQISYYATQSNRVKKQGHTGSAGDWWLRSPYSSVGFCTCNVAGAAGDYGAMNALLVAPFGCV